MNWDNRRFSETRLDTPEIEDEHTKNLFRGLTESRVDMLNAIKREGNQRIKRDDELLEEMYSFGMIECDLFDKDLKFIKLTIADDVVIELPCKSTSTSAFKVVSDTYRVTIQEGTVIYLYPVGRGTTSKKTFVGAYGLRHVGGTLLAFNITYTDFYVNVLNVSLSDCFCTSGEILLPDEEQAPAEVSIALEDMTGYK